MTEENFNYRTSQTMLRNQFNGNGRFKIPIIKKSEFEDSEFDDLRLIGFDRIKPKGDKHLDRMVHFFLYDYKFEKVWKTPENDILKLKRYKAVLSPDFSMYLEMNPTIQLYNTFRNRWCGAYFASKGVRVIPTVSWGDESTFDFCFEGIPKGSTVAVSTYMVSEHGNHADQKEFFLKGYNQMLKTIEPQRIMCYNDPFPEMEGNIVFVDYDLSSWRYQNENNDSKPLKSLNVGFDKLTSPSKNNIIIKQGFVTKDSKSLKGSGSAYGGEWIPKKEKDKRLLGKPGEINKYIKPNGEIYKTKIGSDGRAKLERHYTDHNQPKQHSNPHDHIITWEKGYPSFQQINYRDNDAPEFKTYKEIKQMGKIIIAKDENYDFETISEFKDCVNRGGEIEFEWNGKSYGITRPYGKILIFEVYNEDSEKFYDNADDALNYLIDGTPLRDIVTKMNVTFRLI